MALSANTIWEVRGTNGSDTNGGGYVGGTVGGTDYSQRNTPIVAVTDGVTTSGSPNISSTNATFTSDMVGNIIYIQGGTGSIAASWYQIITFTDSHHIVVNANLPGNSTGVTFNVGGALKTIGQTSSLLVDGNVIFAKAESTYTITSSIAFTNVCSLIGYGSVRGDGLMANIKTSSVGSAITGTLSFRISNIYIDGSDGSCNYGIYNIGDGSVIYNCAFNHCLTYAIELGNKNLISFCSFTNCQVGIYTLNNNIITHCYAEGNSTWTVQFAGDNGCIIFCVIISGSTNPGISCGYNSKHTILSNTIKTNNGLGIILEMGYLPPILGNDNFSIVKNNLLVNCSVGIDNYNTISPNPKIDGNTFLCTTLLGSNVYDQNGYNASFPYTYHKNIILSQNPFKNQSRGDYSLNDLVLGGSLCKSGNIGAPIRKGRGGMPAGAIQSVPRTGGIQSYRSRDRRLPVK